ASVVRSRTYAATTAGHAERPSPTSPAATSVVVKPGRPNTAHPAAPETSANVSASGRRAEEDERRKLMPMHPMMTVIPKTFQFAEIRESGAPSAASRAPTKVAYAM